MNKLTTIILITIGFVACNNKPEKNNDNNLPKEKQQIEKADKLTLDFSEPVLIDSSVYVMYPLRLENNNEAEESFSGSSDRQTTYWNILFYNTATGEYHLLSDSLKMVIYSYTPNNENESVSSTSSSFGFDKFLESGYNQVDRLLYFSITTTDYNEDGKLNSEDPNYLFISDKAGKHFKQISPENFNVVSWETIKATNKILIMATKDSNGDKKFNDDEVFPLVYDLTKNKISTEVFPLDYKLKLKKKFVEQWTPKN